MAGLQLPPFKLLPLVSLLAVNLVPLAGLLFWGWSPASILLSYWAESAVVGFYALLKMKYAQGTEGAITETILGKTETITGNDPRFKLHSMIFFCLHFGGFMFVHLLLLLAAIFVSASIGGSFGLNIFDVLIFVALCFASHGISFVFNYLWGKESERVSVPDLMGEPYIRVIVMHFAVLFGVFLSAQAVILIVLKTFFDVAGHLWERGHFEKGGEKPESPSSA